MESLTRPFFHHRRKLSTASSSNGLSFSGKDDYDDLLSSNKKTKLRRGVVVEDYGEIFGGGGGGFSGVRGSSIPVLDLSDLDRPNGSAELRSSDGQLDYSGIFGAAAGSVPPYEEVFGGGQSSKRGKVKPRATTDKGSKGSDNLNDSDYVTGCLPDASNQVFESAKQMNVSYHKTSQQGREGSKGTTHIAQLNAVSGFTCFVNGDTHLQKQDHDKAPPLKSATNDKRSTGDKLSDGKSDGHKTSQQGKDGSKGNTHIAQFNAVPGFTSFVNGETLFQKQDHDKAPPMKRETNDERNTADKLSDGISGRRAKWKLQNPPTSESVLNEKGDTARNTSGINRRLFHSGEIDVKSLKVPPPSTSTNDPSHPNGKLFYSGELDLKSRPSKVPPLSRSSSQLNDNKVHLNQSKSFAFGSKVESLEKDRNGYLSPSDEELDVESAAAVSAAALKKAIEQAQESIRLAKELMERKHDPMRTRSRSVLKVKDVTETKHDQHFTRVRKNNMKGACEVVETKAPVSAEVDQNIQRANGEVTFAVKDREALQEDRTIEVPKQEESAEAVEGGKSSWFTQLLNNGKNKMAALASQLVDNKNNSILPEKSEQLLDTEIIGPAVETLEKVETVARIPDPEDAKGELNTLHRPTDLDKNVDIPDSDKFVTENDSNVELDEATKKINNKFKEGEKSENKLEDLREMTDDKKLGSGKWEKDHPLEDFVKLVESKDEAENVFKLEKEEMFIALHGLEVNGSTVDAADAGATMERFSQEVKDVDLPNTASGNESNGEKLEDVAEIRLECNSQNETGKQMPIHSHDGAVNQILPEEECLLEGLDPITTSNHQEVATNFGHGNAGKIIENQAIDVTEKLKENDNAASEINQDTESSKTGAWPECGNENHLNSSFDSCDSDNMHMPSEAFEPFGLNEQISQLETANSLKNNILPGQEEEACQLEGRDSEGNDDMEYEEDEDEVEEEVEEAFRSKVSELYESYFNQSNDEGDLLDTRGRKDEENDDLDSEEDEKQVEQTFRLKDSEFYETPNLDQNNGEEDALWTIGRKNEAIDDLEYEPYEKEVEEAVEDAWRLKKNESYETSYLDQSNVKGDVSETLVQGVSKTPASDEKTDNFGSATATNEETTNEGVLSGDVDLLKTTTFIHIGTEEHGTKKDRDSDEPPPEECLPKFGFTDTDTRIQRKENDDDPNIFVGPDINAGLVNARDACVENITEDIMDAFAKEVEKGNNVEDHQEKDGVEKHEEPSDSPVPSNYEKCKEHSKTDSVSETGQSTEVFEENLTRTKRESTENTEGVQKGTGTNEFFKKIEIIKRERERQKDRIAVERAIREARERAFAEARERAERAAVEKASAEVRQRVMAGAREKLGKVASGKVSMDKTSTESKLKAERAAVERATAEARERALEKAISQKINTEARSVAGKAGAGKSHSSTNTGLKHSLSSPDLERFDDSNNESAQRRKARLERHQRIMERAAKALAEKNMRDILAQREQAERNRLAETLDAEIKRWASGKEGNLRALLSTLQYILGANSGWQPITLTEIVTTAAVKKAYRKATLYVHPDKLQQRGASIQQKYICEKVFDLLKAAWNKFNSEER